MTDAHERPRLLSEGANVLPTHKDGSLKSIVFQQCVHTMKDPFDFVIPFMVRKEFVDFLVKLGFKSCRLTIKEAAELL